jgi:hypothetical protein
VAEEEDSTAAVAEDFMEVAEPRFAGVEVSMGEPGLGSAADARTAYIVEAATTEVAAVTAGAEATAGAEDIGAEDTVTDGAGDLALGGRIGVGAIRMAITTIRGIPRLTLIILTRTVLRTIPRAIRILTTGTTMFQRQIPTRDPCPTRTDPQDPGDHQYREAERTPT